MQKFEFGEAHDVCDWCDFGTVWSDTHGFLSERALTFYDFSSYPGNVVTLREKAHGDALFVCSLGSKAVVEQIVEEGR